MNGVTSLNPLACRTDDDENDDGHEDHQEADGDGSFQIAGTEFQPDGRGKDFGFKASGAGKDQDGAKLPQATCPGNAEGGDEAASCAGKADLPKGLKARGPQGEGHLFRPGRKMIEGAAHGADGKGCRDDELRQDDACDGIGEWEYGFDGFPELRLKKDQQAQADHHGREDDGDIQSRIHPGLGWEGAARHQIADGNGDERGHDGRRGGGDQTQPDGIADLWFRQCGNPCLRVAVAGTGPDEQEPEKEVSCGHES